MLGGTFPPPYAVSVDHQNAGAPRNGPHIGLDEQRFSVSGPVVVTEDDSYALTVRGQQTHLSEPLSFSDRGVGIPDRFGSAEMGLSWLHRANEGEEKYGGSFSLGSAGPRPLADTTKPILNASVNYERPLPDGNAWVFFVAYSNNRSVLNNVPLPGVAYVINGKDSKAVLGLPFVFLIYRPDPWLLLTTVTPFFANAEAGYRFWGPLQAYANTAWTPKAYQNLLEDDGDHLIFEKKELGLGLRLFLSRQISFSAGWTRDFDRRFLLGKSLRDQSSSAVRLEDSDGFKFSGRVAF